MYRYEHNFVKNESKYNDFHVNTLSPRQNGRNFADAIFKCIFVNENVCISLDISLNFVPKVRINNIGPEKGSVRTMRFKSSINPTVILVRYSYVDFGER